MTTILYFFFPGFSQISTVDGVPNFIACAVYQPGLQQGRSFIPGMQRATSYIPGMQGGIGYLPGGIDGANYIPGMQHGKVVPN